MAVPKFIQGIGKAAVAVSTTTAALNTTANNLIVITAVVDSGTIAISDSKSNAWTPVAAQVNHSDAVQSLRMYYGLLTTAGGGHTFTVSGATNACGIAVQQFSGLDITSALDQTTSSTGVTSASMTSGNTGVTAYPNEFVVAGGSLNFSDALTLGTGFTNLTTSTATSWLAVGQESKIISSTGAQNAVMTGNAADDWILMVATFKVAFPSIQTNNLRPHAFSPGLAR